MSTYIVTGGMGFIGSHIVNELMRQYHKVIIIDDLSTGDPQNIDSYWDQYDFIESDLSDEKNLKEIYRKILNTEIPDEKIDGVFHFAAQARIQPSVHDPESTVKTNVLSTLNVLKLMEMCGCKNIVYASSSSIYGKHFEEFAHMREDYKESCQTPYSVSKHMGEKMIQTWGRFKDIKNVCLRYFNVYGPRSPLIGQYSPVIGKFFEQALKKQKLTIVGDGNQRRDFTYVDDAVFATIKAMMNIDKCNGEIINVGTGENYTIMQVAEFVYKSIYGKDYLFDSVDDCKMIESRVGEAQNTLASTDKAGSLLKWLSQVDLEEGIARCLPYYKKVFTC